MESLKLFPGHPFSSPKPEALLQRVLQIASDPGDLVLDSFAGSGTTGAVAHKMGRRWIMVELGEHCHTHIIPRLKKVIDGEDPGGITEAVGWKGGGGFRYFRLAPSLLEKDQLRQLDHQQGIQRRHAGRGHLQAGWLQYAPSETSTGSRATPPRRDFIYVTTQTLTREQLDQR